MGSSVLDQLQTFGPDHCEPLTLEQAVAYTRELATTHYENFTVVSRLLPKRLRDDFRNVYSFCRWADDLGDETGDRERSVELLEWWRRELDLCYADTPRHPVFIALRPTIDKHDIPRKPFDDLIDAFLQDQRVVRYDTWNQVCDYCTRSADPVGRLVLYLTGYRDDQRQRLSDATCTALQLTNFWQDVRRDVLERDRVYVPRDIALSHGLDVDAMVDLIKRHDAAVKQGDASCDRAVTDMMPAYRATVADLCDRTWPLFLKGHALWPLVDADVRADIKLFSLGGEAVLRMIEKRGYNTLLRRPSLSKASKARLMAGALVGKVAGRFARTNAPAATPAPAPAPREASHG